MADKTSPSQEMHPDSESDDEEVVETSPCGRWEKHRKEVSQKNVPGIDSSYLAMDTEEGVEVVWNEVLFSEKRSWKNKEATFKRIFENLTQLDHPNIVKFHKYWVDMRDDQPRLIFITEFMTSGSLTQFLKKTKSNNKTLNLKAWKRWCKQILSALSYLHGCDPPIVHGNLSCDTIFIQHNGLMKIGTVAPESIHRHVKTCKQEAKNMHFVAPEYDGQTLYSALSSPEYGLPGTIVNCAADIYSFGMVALELAALVLETADGKFVTPESIQESLDRIDDAKQKDFVRQCLQKDPPNRPSVKDLLLHEILLEVYSLKVLTGHHIVDENINHPESVDEVEPEKVMAEICHPNGEIVEWKYSKVQPLELEKFLEELRIGLYPLTGMQHSRSKKESHPLLNRTKAEIPIREEVGSTPSPEPEEETRAVVNMQCSVITSEEAATKQMTLLLKFEDRMNRQLTCEVQFGEKSEELADELVRYGFINGADRIKVSELINENLQW
ncbi:nuclear receptor-binding protein-like isoform X2 [Rhopilema esculentum]|uniref:nuclear receptor-binding protein-like isoform X2 n=1 Tax=Rhopilema esculentum TaxID=499914 RepID=UPI0031D9F854